MRGNNNKGGMMIVGRDSNGKLIRIAKSYSEAWKEKKLREEEEKMCETGRDTAKPRCGSDELVANAALFLRIVVAFCYNLFWPGVVSWEGDGAPFEKSNQDINYKYADTVKRLQVAARKEILQMPCAEIDDLDNAHLLAEGIIDKAEGRGGGKTGEEDDAHDMSEIIEERIKQMSVLPRRKESLRKARKRHQTEVDFSVRLLLLIWAVLSSVVIGVVERDNDKRLLNENVVGLDETFGFLFAKDF
ncbi:hypothetical protein Tco_0861814 [Tanacetum coccineum]